MANPYQLDVDAYETAYKRYAQKYSREATAYNKTVDSYNAQIKDLEKRIGTFNTQAQTWNTSYRGDLNKLTAERNAIIAAYNKLTPPAEFSGPKAPVAPSGTRAQEKAASVGGTVAARNLAAERGLVSEVLRGKGVIDSAGPSRAAQKTEEGESLNLSLLGLQPAPVYNSFDGGGGGGGCYVTTAACQYKGLPDDCDELQSLRGFRDEWLAKSEKGRQTIAKYYRFAPYLVSKIAGKTDELERIWKTITKVVKAIKQKNYPSAHKQYHAMCTQLLEKYFPEHRDLTLTITIIDSDKHSKG